MDAEDEDEVWEKRSALAHERQAPTTPTCCPAAQDLKPLVLTSHYDGRGPRWYLRLRYDYNYPVFDPVTPTDPRFCPYCGKALPEFELKAVPPAPLCVTDEYGDYCATCTERSMNCWCYPPWAVWQAKETA